MNNTRFYVTVGALLIGLLGFFWIVAGCLSTEIWSEERRQRDCVAAGNEYVYNSKSGNYDCVNN